MARTYRECLGKVDNRGTPSEAFLNELVDWCLSAPDEIFIPNIKFDIYSSVVGTLGPWRDLKHRRAVMLEVLRVLGGFESSWRWDADVDTTNPRSITPCTMEAGIFQCSGNSMNFDSSLKQLLLDTGSDGSCDSFRTTTKANHPFAIEYCARLLRFTTKHHGPVKGGHIHKFLRREAVNEFLSFL